MSDSRQGLSILYIAVFLLSLNGLFSKIVPIDAVSVTQLRSVVAVLTLIMFALLQKRQLRLDSAKQYVGIYLIGVIMGLHWISFFHSMQISTVAIGMLSLFTYPIITVLIEPFYNKHRIELADIFAGILVLVGVYLMVEEDIHQLSSDTVQGVFWGVISAFLFAMRNLLQKYYYADVSADRLMLHQVVAIAFMLLVFVDYPQLNQFSSKDWLMLLLLGAVSTATAHTLLSYSLKHLPAKSIAMISCLQPLFATLFAWLLLDETPTQAIVLGGLIIVSVALYESIKKSGIRYKRNKESS